MLELGEFIGDGGNAMFFRIRGHPNIGIKILKYLDSEESKEYLGEELKIAKILMKLNLPVPKYSEIIQIKVPEYFEKTLEKGIIRNVPELLTENKNAKIEKRQLITKMNNSIIYGLLMEYIDHDLSLISQKRLKYIYQKEKAKVESYGIKIIDSGPTDNVLWSQSKAKLYFIDFELWNLSNLHE